MGWGGVVSTGDDVGLVPCDWCDGSGEGPPAGGSDGPTYPPCSWCRSTGRVRPEEQAPTSETDGEAQRRTGIAQAISLCEDERARTASELGTDYCDGLDRLLVALRAAMGTPPLDMRSYRLGLEQGHREERERYAEENER